MQKKSFTSRLGRKSAKFIAPIVLAALVFVAATPGTAEAHCDSADGPVVTSAKQAIEENNVNLALPYVGPQYEAELKDAFDKTMAARQAGGEAQAVADNYFYETTVRLHRATENASYTGIKPAGQDFGPALEAAELAIETGSTEELKQVLTDAINEQVDVQFAKVTATNVGADASVEAKRESVEAQFGFEKYALGIYEAANAAGGHSEGGEAAAGGHDHGAATTDAHGAEAAETGEAHEGEEDGLLDSIILALAAVGVFGIGAVVGRKAGVKHASGNCNH